MTTAELKSRIRVIEDFPKPGIHFQDITSLFMDAECLHALAENIYELYKDKGITKVVGLESRGFVLGAILAEKLGAGFIPARKKGKLPGETFSETYELEYGSDTIEMHTNAISENDVVLIHDDLLATGGTLSAACRLVRRFSPKEIYMNVVIDLTGCPKIAAFPKDVELTSLINVDEG